MRIKIIKNIAITCVLVFLVALFFYIAYKPMPDEAMFRVSLEVPNEVTAGNFFQADGYLHNESRFEWSILHGADLFQYRVFDHKGEQFDQSCYDVYVLNHIGMAHKLKAKSQYTNDGEGHIRPKLNEVCIDSPGDYSIISVVEFSIEDPRIPEERKFIIESAPYPLKVK